MDEKPTIPHLGVGAFHRARQTAPWPASLPVARGASEGQALIAAAGARLATAIAPG